MTGIAVSRLTQAVLLASTMLALPGVVLAAERNTAIDGNNGTLPLPTGQYVTPQLLTGAVQQPLNPHLPAYPDFVAGMAVRSQLSPDGTTLAIICAGQNSLLNATATADIANSTQYIFIYDVSGANKTSPVQKQVIKQTNAFVGLAWAPDGKTLYAAGGNDDVVYVYSNTGGMLTAGTPIPLGHSVSVTNATTGVTTKTTKGIGIGVQSNAGGLAISADGSTLVVANNYNDSISVIDTAKQAVRYEHDLRPFFANNEGASGIGGTFPYAVALKGNGTAYVSSDRDREVVVVDISQASGGKLIKRIKLDGNALGMTFDLQQARLFVAQDNADQVAVIDTVSNAITHKIDTRGPAGLIEGKYTGAAPSSVVVGPQGKRLYVVNSGANSVAVIPLEGDNAYTVTGLIPTAYDPHDISVSNDGSWIYIVNGKSDTGPNPRYLYSNTARVTNVTLPGGNAAAVVAAGAANQYQFQLEHATLVSAQAPGGADLPTLTSQVALNNGYNAAPIPSDESTMAFMHSKIQHVIYIVKENRTFDQILGDLKNGANADPTLTMFGQQITPNFHRLSNRFVTLDNFMDPGDGSMDGWSWSMAGRVTNTETITQQINYAFVNRGLSYESEGENRSVPVGLPTTEARDAAKTGGLTAAGATLPGGAANVLVGPGNHAATDAPYGVQNGYIFDAVLQAGGTVRNYGFLVDNIGAIGTIAAPIVDPFTAGVQQVAAVNPSLLDKTDLYFRGYDQNYPDLWRYNEWKREFDRYVTGGTMPNLELVRFSHDHTGSFATALGGVNTPETMQADNDLSVAKVIEAVAHSPFANSTVIMVTEDDCQDGPDHFDSHRTTAYVAGAYVKQGAVVKTRYNQVSMLRTIEDLLGTQHINLNTAYQRPMAHVFDTSASGGWTYTAIASRVLATTTLALAENGIGYADGADVVPKHDAAYWAHATRGFDFSDADRVPVDLYNEVMWQGMMDGQPYPTHRNGLNLGGR